jgi:hypothetical protein
MKVTFIAKNDTTNTQPMCPGENNPTHLFFCLQSEGRIKCGWCISGGNHSHLLR